MTWIVTRDDRCSEEISIPAQPLNLINYVCYSVLRASTWLTTPYFPTICCWASQKHYLGTLSHWTKLKLLCFYFTLYCFLKVLQNFHDFVMQQWCRSGDIFWTRGLLLFVMTPHFIGEDAMSEFLSIRSGEIAVTILPF